MPAFPAPLPATFGYLPSASSVPGTSLELDTSIAETDRGRLLSQFHGRPRIEALATILAGRLQRIEVALWQLLVERRIDTALGLELDVIGRRLGVARDGRRDDAYRRRLRAEILVLRSSGSPEDLIAIVRAFAGDDSVELDELYPAELAAVLGMELGDVEALDLASLLARAKAAGVRLVTEYLTQPATATWTLASGVDLTESDDALGLGWSGDTDLGGQLAGATERGAGA